MLILPLNIMPKINIVAYKLHFRQALLKRTFPLVGEAASLDDPENPDSGICEDDYQQNDFISCLAHSIQFLYCLFCHTVAVLFLQLTTMIFKQRPCADSDNWRVQINLMGIYGNT